MFGFTRLTIAIIGSWARRKWRSRRWARRRRAAWTWRFHDDYSYFLSMRFLLDVCLLMFSDNGDDFFVIINTIWFDSIRLNRSFCLLINRLSNDWSQLYYSKFFSIIMASLLYYNLTSLYFVLFYIIIIIIFDYWWANRWISVVVLRFFIINIRLIY